MAGFVVGTVHAVGMLTSMTLASHGPLRGVGAVGTYPIGVAIGVTAI
ncbi:hypothetical protein [Kribbella swartbergensis]